MAEVVELFGAPGTGKSSLVAALDGRRVAGRTLVAASRLTRVPRVGRTSGRSAADLAGRLGALLASRLPDGARRALLRELTPAERRAALALRREGWSALLDLVADAPLGRDDPDPLRALHGPGWLAASLELRALAHAAPADVVVLLDEGLVQRTNLMCGRSPDDVTLHRFLDRLPPTALHVHLFSETGVTLSRLRGRERVIDRHVGLEGEALEASVVADAALLARAAAHLGTRAHASVRLDTSVASPETLADELAGELTDVLAGRSGRDVGVSGSEPAG